MSILTMWKLLLQGFEISVLIFVVTLVLSLPLGLGVALCRMSKNPVLRGITKVYISVMRGTPLMLQLLVVRFGPWFVFKMKLDDSYDIWAVLIAFVINYAAYFAEIYRSGIESVPKGQYEAAQILGFGRWRTFFAVIMPQVIKRVLPSVTNEIITLVKDTSLAYAIGLIEMFTRAKQIAAAETSMLPYLFAGILYYIFNYVVAFGMEKAEKAFGYYEIK
ncbi:MAG: amino acid ABC transporter permease [Clostridia bacterium]|nr:amino acid ABC transporter permease [Clostridia bacterium]